MWEKVGGVFLMPSNGKKRHELFSIPNKFESTLVHFLTMASKNNDELQK